MTLITDSTFNEALTYIYKAGDIVFDTETTGLDIFAGNRICGFAIRADEEDFYFPFRHGEGENISGDKLPEMIAMLQTKTWTGWNSKFDLRMLLADGYKFPEPGQVKDVMLAAHLINENEQSFALKTLGKRYVDPSAVDEAEGLAEELKKRKLKKGDMWRLPAHLVQPYAEKDVELTAALYDFYVPRLKSQKLLKIWHEVNEYMLVIARMEMRGMLLDVEQIKHNVAEAAEKAKQAADDLEQMLGYRVNPNSAPQVCALLHIKSSSVDVLEGMDHPAIQYIIDYRRWGKVTSTYYGPFVNAMDRKGVLHPNINQIGTVTGRQSSFAPNMHAIPRKEEKFEPKNYVKQVFVSRPGYSLIQCDYKQAELYLGSHYAKAHNMTRYLRDGIDVHGETAARLNIPRPIAKRLNFAMMYGIGDETLQQDMWKTARIRITLAEAHKYRTAYNKLHPEMKKLYSKAAKLAKEQGYIELFTGRRRHYNDLRFDTAMLAPSPPHKASSNLVQGGVSEFLRISAMRIDRDLRPLGVHQLLHVHDSIIFEVKDELVDEMVPRIVDIMTDFPLTVRLKVDVEVGKRWYNLLPWKEKETA